MLGPREEVDAFIRVHRDVAEAGEIGVCQARFDAPVL